MVNLYGIGLEYPDVWELTFHRPPTITQGGLEIIQSEGGIHCVVNVLWRPLRSMGNGHRSSRGIFGNLDRLISRNRKSPPFPEATQDQLLEQYCERIYQKIRKQQGEIAILSREQTVVNGHTAESSDFSFPAKKRGSKERMRRIQVIFCCDQTDRLVALYGSMLSSQHEIYLQPVRDILSTIRCH
jgi:hypothetical protein